MNRRRALLATCALAAAPLAGKAQQAGKLPRVGYLALSSSAEGTPVFDAFRDGLAARGYRDGRTIAIDVRFAEDRQERLAPLAAELVGQKVDVLVIAGCGKPFMDAARRPDRSIPLVVVICGDLPGFMGEVASLAKPGGNTTGQTMFSPELAVKRLQLLKELVPKLSAVAVLWNPASEGWDPYWQALRSAGAALGVALHSVEVRSQDGFDAAFNEVVRSKAEALLTLLDDILWIGRKRVVAFALQRRLPGAYDLERYVLEGGLLAYEPDLQEMGRGAAGQVDRILKGTHPREIPVERSAKFRLVVNLRAAKSLGIAVPQSILQRADRVIE
jgi:putative ABC transport system substrate-binding protein